MIVIEEMCARIGLIAGGGLASVIKRKYSQKVVFPIAALLLIANTINIGADIAAMGASVRIIFPQIPTIIVTVSFTTFILTAEILLPYGRYVKILKYLTISLFAYILTAIIVGGDWNEILVASIIPYIEFTPEFAMMLVAVFGTTISPYLFFWQASEEAEEDVLKHKIKEIDGEVKPAVTNREVGLMKQDIAIGMAFSLSIMWAIIVTSSGSLHSNGLTDIQTSEQAAEALKSLVKTFPNAGEIAKIIFALGIVGTGLLAIPILAGSCAYALSDVFGWKEGLNKKFNKAKSFYLIISLATVVGLGINFVDVSPIKALVYTAVINGLTAVPILIVIMKIANDKRILGDKTNRPISNIIGWLTILIMGISIVIITF